MVIELSYGITLFLTNLARTLAKPAIFSTYLAITVAFLFLATVGQKQFVFSKFHTNYSIIFLKICQ